MPAHAPTFPTAAPAAIAPHDLEPTVAEVETRLQALGDALLARDATALERCAGELQRALTEAVARFSQVARSGSQVPTALRQRLVRATGAVAAHRESLSRATAALDRAMDVLMPSEAEWVYRPAPGRAFGPARRGSLHA